MKGVHAILYVPTYSTALRQPLYRFCSIHRQSSTCPSTPQSHFPAAFFADSANNIVSIILDYSCCKIPSFSTPSFFPLSDSAINIISIISDYSCCKIPLVFYYALFFSSQSVLSPYSLISRCAFLSYGSVSSPYRKTTINRWNANQ